MRKIENEMLFAVRSRKNWHSGNTKVLISDGGNLCKVYLHGNLIYTDCLESNERKFTLAGWNTPTTHSRLRALGVNVKQKNFMPYYNGEAILSSGWYSVK